MVARFASGAPAAVLSAFGRGKALMLGSYVSAGYLTQPEETTRRFYAGLLDWAGVTRPVVATGDPVEVRTLESGREHLAFVFNHGAAPATAQVALRLPLGGREVVEITTDEKVAVEATPDGFSWRGTIPPRDVLVLRVR